VSTRVWRSYRNHRRNQTPLAAHHHDIDGIYIGCIYHSHATRRRGVRASTIAEQIIAIDVMMMGRKRSLIAAMVAGMISIPESTRSFANSTIRIAFFAARPINVTKPICAITLFVNEGINVKVNIAPNAPVGTASNTENGTDQLSYNAARNKKYKQNG